MTASLRMLAYRVAADFIDEYLRIRDSTAMKSLYYFVKAVVEIYFDQYLRSPNNNDIAKLLAVGKSCGFPGMLGSIDSIASYDLWIWHAFFGLHGSHNDINVLEKSTVFTELAQGRAPPINYTISGNEYTMGYYLADGIYPPWATFVKTIPCPQGNKKKHFTMAQEACKKDVERAFGVLQARFAIVRGSARSWNLESIKVVMKACIILHNMIIEDERDDNEA
ncbi:uncharacterized protein LOC114302837 [Camellia sinensis]|uniref:uncharacterized protein LOC114302837 n=1 Tax=Camellia sinensis TaxID=4442 RepID=UPI0010359F54|nr:uncharacterized protein LOC114302837 [Camellia sinensis]